MVYRKISFELLHRHCRSRVIETTLNDMGRWVTLFHQEIIMKYNNLRGMLYEFVILCISYQNKGNAFYVTLLTAKLTIHVILYLCFGSNKKECNRSIDCGGASPLNNLSIQQAFSNVNGRYTTNQWSLLNMLITNGLIVQTSAAV